MAAFDPESTLGLQPFASMTPGSPFHRAPAFWHPVGAGDTLRGLAERFALSAESLAAANHLSPTATLAPGQRVEIPGFVAFPVAPHDTLYALRVRTGLSAGALARYNDLGDDSALALRGVVAIPAPRRTLGPWAKVRVRRQDGAVLATRGGREQALGLDAREAFSFLGGAYLVWTAERKKSISLHLQEAATGKARVLLEGLREVSSLASARLTTGRLLFWVHGVEGVTGEPLLSVLDPDRGELFRQAHTEVRGRAADVLTLRSVEPHLRGAPVRQTSLDLSAL